MHQVYSATVGWHCATRRKIPQKQRWFRSSFKIGAVWPRHPGKRSCRADVPDLESSTDEKSKANGGGHHSAFYRAYCSNVSRLINSLVTATTKAIRAFPPIGAGPSLMVFVIVGG
jgi:hypothetical protein